MVAEGDSITSQIPTSGQTSWVYFLPAFPPNWKLHSFNVATSGLDSVSALARDTALVDPLYNPTGTNVYVLWVGTNDCEVGRDPNTTWSNLVANSAARRAVGFKTVIGTMMSRGNGFDACKNVLNPIIRANWSGNFDGLADVAAVPQLGDDGAYANTTYFADTIHPTTFASHTLIEPVFETAIKALVP